MHNSADDIKQTLHPHNSANSNQQLQKYNPNYELPPFGLQNMGVTCYYNSLIQGLFSCPAFTETMLNPAFYGNELARTMGFLAREALCLPLQSGGGDVARGRANPAALSQLGPASFRALIGELARESRDNAMFACQQQDVAEAFTLILQCLEKFAPIQSLFQHRRANQIFCRLCNDWVSNVAEMNFSFCVEPTLSLEQLAEFADMEARHGNSARNLNDFLMNQTGYVDEDYRCPKCAATGNKFLKSRLSMAPEILFVVAKKYEFSGGHGRKLDLYVDFPRQLTFGGIDGKLTYEPVCQIEHLGGLNGGHYYAVCRRQNGWYCLNDMGIEAAEFRPTINTYVVIYHIV